MGGGDTVRRENDWLMKLGIKQKVIYLYLRLMWLLRLLLKRYRSSLLLFISLNWKSNRAKLKEKNQTTCRWDFSVNANANSLFYFWWLFQYFSVMILSKLFILFSHLNTILACCWITTQRISRVFLVVRILPAALLRQFEKIPAPCHAAAGYSWHPEGIYGQ